MTRVDACPKNLTEVIEAANRLKCGNDEYGNSQYLCLPKSDNTSLVEFCYNGIIGLQQAGNCLQASKETFTRINCTSFSFGCPEEHFKSNEMYKYPACQNIDWEHRCYLQDPSCPPKSEDNHTWKYGLIGGCIAIVTLIFVIYVLLKKWKGKGSVIVTSGRDAENQHGEVYGKLLQVKPEEGGDEHMEENANAKDDASDENKANLLKDSNLNKKSSIKRYKETEKNKTDTDAYLWVAAIDFGTTYTGYGFGCREDLKENPNNSFLSAWSTDGGQTSTKTPTTVLLDKDKNLVAFGYEAVTTYADLADEKLKDYFYFHKFKMMLSDKVKTSKVTLCTEISDIRGQKVKAMTVFSYAIRYLRKRLLQSLKEKTSTVNEEDVLWVLTVPAMWDDVGRLFMRKAAEEAGIPGYQLMIALEAEAGFLYCQHLPIENLAGSNSTSEFQPGSKYIVLDAGGGTIDVTVHEVKDYGHLKELECASGGNWGGTSIDLAFLKALEDIVMEGTIEGYCQNHFGDYTDLLKNFEAKKCNLEKNHKSFITLRIPFTFIKKCTKTLEPTITTLTNQSRFNDHFTRIIDKLRIDKATFESFFQPTCNKIIDHVKQLFKLPKVKDVKKILMVGGVF